MGIENLKYFIVSSTVYRTYHIHDLPYEYKWMIADTVKKYVIFDNVYGLGWRCCGCEELACIVAELFETTVALCKTCKDNKISPHSTDVGGTIFETSNFRKSEKYVKVEILHDNKMFSITEEMCSVGKIVEFLWQETEKYGGCFIDGCDIDEDFNCECVAEAVRCTANMLATQQLLLRLIVCHEDIAKIVTNKWLRLIGF